MPLTARGGHPRQPSVIAATMRLSKLFSSFGLGLIYLEFLKGGQKGTNCSLLLYAYD